MFQNFLRKFFVLFFLCTAFYTHAQNWSSRGSVAFPILMPLSEGKDLFDKNSSYLSSLSYSVTLSSYLPKRIQKFTSRWGLTLGSSWIHNFPSFKSEDVLPSYYPAVMDLGVQWELDYFPLFITPVLGWSYAMSNPFQKEEIQNVLPETLQSEYLYIWKAGILLSFDIFNRHFSKRMQHEYNIYDMGLYAEYRRYIATKDANLKIQGWSFGFFATF